MKSYVTSGTGSEQTLRDSQNNKVPVYDSLADVEADLANLAEGQLALTKDTGDELAQPVNVVESGNLHAVSSNAVAESLGGSMIKSYYFTFDIGVNAGNGFVNVENIPSEIKMDGVGSDKCNVIGCSIWWGNIDASKGLQLQLMNISSNTAYINYYKPANMLSVVNAKCKIYYIV